MEQMKKAGKKVKWRPKIILYKITLSIHALSWASNLVGIIVGMNKELSCE